MCIKTEDYTHFLCCSCCWSHCESVRAKLFCFLTKMCHKAVCKSAFLNAPVSLHECRIQTSVTWWCGESSPLTQVQKVDRTLCCVQVLLFGRYTGDTTLMSAVVLCCLLIQSIQNDAQRLLDRTLRGQRCRPWRFSWACFCMCDHFPAGGDDGAAAGFGTESASSRAWRELAGSLCAVASVSPGESSRHRGNHHQHHHDYQSSGDEANEDGEEDYIAAAEAAIAALGSRVDSRCRSFRDCKPLLIHNSSGTAAREFRRAPVQVLQHSGLRWMASNY